MKKEEMKSNVGTGISSTIGAAVGVVGGTLASDEIHAEAVTPAEDGGFESDGDEDVSVVDSDPANAPAQNPANAPAQGQSAATAPVAGQSAGEAEVTGNGPSAQPASNTQEPEGGVQVLAYETVTNEDGSQSDMALVTDGNTQAIIVDANRDGVADVMAVDMNHDGHISENEVMDISDQQVSMQSLQDAATGTSGDGGMMAQNASEPDYVNNADVDGYMA